MNDVFIGQNRQGKMKATCSCMCVLPIVDSTSMDDATFSASSMLLNFSFTKSKFLQQMVSVPC